MAVAMVWLRRVVSIVAWPDKAPHVYARYGFPQDPGVHASLGLTEEAVGFTSYLESGQVVEADCRKPPAEIPKGLKAFPPWLLLQFTDEGIEPACRLHLAAVAAAEPLAGRPVPTPDLATAIPFEADAFRRVHEFHVAQLRPFFRQALMIPPLWLASTVFAFAVQVRG
jgi:hypothetical protein